MNLRLKYREPGVREGTGRWAVRRVESVREAIAWMNANREIAFTPAFVETPGNRWQRSETVAILGSVDAVGERVPESLEDWLSRPVKVIGGDL